jgi:hypothetical protein
MQPHPEPACPPITVTIAGVQQPFPGNQAPTIAKVAAQITDEDVNVSNLSVTIGDSDGDLVCATALTGSSSNTALVPNTNLVITGTYPNCLLSATPALNQHGSTTITLTVSDGSLSTSDTFVLAVNAVNDVPTLAIAGDTSKTTLRNTVTSVALAAGSDPDTVTGGQSLVYFVAFPPAHGTLSGLPSGATTTGAVSYTPDNGYLGADSFAYQICDSTSPPACTAITTVAITVYKVNDPPTDITLSASSIAENAGSNATVGSLSTIDSDTGDSFTYTKVTGTGDTDNSSFTITGSDLILNASANFEAKSSYSVRIRAADALGSSTEKAFTISITNANEAPTDITLSANSIVENAGSNATVGSLSTTDPDAGDSFTYTLVAGTGDTDNSAFSINTAALTMNSSANFEAKSSYSVRIRAADALGSSTEKSFTISITNANEAPTDITLSANSIVENAGSNATVGYLSTIDPDAGDSFTYTKVTGTGDTDNSAFTITGSDLILNASANFEAKSSYSVRIRSADALGSSTEKAFTVSITNVNDAPTDIALSNTNFNESQPANSVVGSLSTTDGDTGDTFTYALATGTGDTDNTAFNISGDSLSMTGSADYDIKNSYSVRVRSTDADGATFEKSFTIAILALNSTPTISDVGNQTTNQDTAISNIAVTIGDTNGPLVCSTALSAYADDTTLMPTSRFVIKGTYPDCAVSLKPGDGLLGSTTVHLVVTDGTASAEDTFTLTVNLAVPSAARYLSAESGLDGSVALTWAAPRRGGAPTSYKIYRSTTSTVDTSGAALATVTAPTVTYTDSTVTNGTPYWYAVVASNTAGDAAAATRTMRALPLAADAAADANNVFIANTGSNTTGNGSIGNPYQTLSFGMGAVNSGGTLFLKDGTYGAEFVGTWGISKSMTIQSMTGDYRTSAAIVSDGDLRMTFGANNVSILGIEGVYVAMRGTDGLRTGLKFINCLFRDNPTRDFIVGTGAPSGTNRYVNFEVYGNSFQSFGTKGTNSRSVLLSWYTGNDNLNWTVEENLFQDTSWMAINIGTNGGYTIKDNEFKGNCDGAIQIHDYGSSGTSGTITITGNVFENNTSAGCLGGATGTGIALSSAGTWSTNLSANVTNNTFTGNGAAVRFHIAYGGSCGASVSSRITAFTGNSIATSNTLGLGFNCAGGTLNATSNYWGDSTGPTVTGNPLGTGASITLTNGSVTYSPFNDF